MSASPPKHSSARGFCRERKEVPQEYTGHNQNKSNGSSGRTDSGSTDKRSASTKRPCTRPAFASDKSLPDIEGSQLDRDTKRCYKTGWRLLNETTIAGYRIDRITTADAEILQFPGTGSNANCALRTLRRMLSLAREWNIIQGAAKIKLRKEKQRSTTFTSESEKAFLKVAPQPLKDVFLISQDSGLRPDEIIRMLWDNVLWDKNLIFNPDGKTERARRHVPLSGRVGDLLKVRAQGEESQWVCPSSRQQGSHMSYFQVARQFGEARKKAGLPQDIVLVQKMLGHESVNTTQRYLHPELRDIAELVNQRNVEYAQNLRHTQRGIQ
jgi:integrase